MTWRTLILESTTGRTLFAWVCCWWQYQDQLYRLWGRSFGSLVEIFKNSLEKTQKKQGRSTACVCRACWTEGNRAADWRDSSEICRSRSSDRADDWHAEPESERRANWSSGRPAGEPIDHKSVLTDFLFEFWIRFWFNFRSFDFLFFVDSLVIYWEGIVPLFVTRIGNLY